MAELTVTRALLQDSFDRARELVEQLADGLTEDVAGYRPDPEANSVAWLLWHLARVQDDHVADLAGTAQAWETWRDRFGLPFAADTIGYGHSPAEAGQVRANGELLAGYYADVDALTRDYLAGLTVEELPRVVDERWDPPVTAAVRLVSVLGDVLQHLGQAAYVRGLAERRAAADPTDR